MNTRTVTQAVGLVRLCSLSKVNIKLRAPKYRKTITADFFLLEIHIVTLKAFPTIQGKLDESIQSGAPNDNFLSDPLKRYFRRSGVALKLYRFILGSAIILLSVRSSFRN